MAASSSVRDEFRSLKRLSEDRPAGIDRFIAFLTFMTRLHFGARPERSFVEYRNVKL